MAGEDLSQNTAPGILNRMEANAVLNEILDRWFQATDIFTKLFQEMEQKRKISRDESTMASYRYFLPDEIIEAKAKADEIFQEYLDKKTEIESVKNNKTT